MTVRLLVGCDGTPADRPGMALGSCRAYLPTRATALLGARIAAAGAGWSHVDGRDLCPSCTTARNRCAHTSTMRLVDGRVCADCGAPR